MKFNQKWLLRAITPSGESTSLGHLGVFASPEKALAALEIGDVTLPNGCYGQAVSVFVPEAEGKAGEEKAAAKPKANTKAPAASKATPKAPTTPPPAPPSGEGKD